MTENSVAADFVARFRDFWSAPTPDRLDMLLRPDVRLVSPLMPPTHTLDEAKEGWAGLLAFIPDLSNQVRRWGPSEDGVFIEFTLSGTVGGSTISWDVVDRFILDDDGQAIERVAYYDPAPLTAALGTS
jgi:hypothetical protein